MPINKITKKDELPEWFDLNKYQDASSLTPLDWYEQLIVRYKLQHALKTSDWKDSWADTAHTAEDIKSTALEFVRRQPIVKLDESTDIYLLRFFYDSELLDYGIGAHHPLIGVHPTTVIEHFLYEKYLTGDQSSYARNHVIEREGEIYNPIKAKYPLTDWIEEPIDKLIYKKRGSTKMSITVNLALPNEVLENQFHLILKELRSDQDYKSTLTEKRFSPKYKIWLSHRILPYLDLRIWEIETGKEIKKDLLIETLWPRPFEAFEYKLRTTKKTAKELMSENYLKDLAAFTATKITVE